MRRMLQGPWGPRCRPRPPERIGRQLDDPRQTDRMGRQAPHRVTPTEHAVSDMVSYYAQRAPEYDRIYDLPLWQDDLRRLEALTSRVFAGRRVFETACGTGYWTR